MIRQPGLPHPGGTCNAIVETVDIFPTLAKLCDLDLPANLDGRSLLPLMRDPKSPSTKPAYAFWTGGQRTVRTDRWRLIANPKGNNDVPQVELFDYEIDPDETQNHAKAQPAIVAELLGILDQAPASTMANAKIPRKK